MDEILRGKPGWRGPGGRCPASARHGRFRVDDRLMPRTRSGDTATPLPRYDRATMPPARPASTLLLLYPGRDGELRLPLTVRNASLRAHAGEVSLPGGAVEEADA